MNFHKDAVFILRPLWNKGISTRVSVGLALASNFALQRLVAFVNEPYDTDNDDNLDQIIKDYAQIIALLDLAKVNF